MTKEQLFSAMQESIAAVTRANYPAFTQQIHEIAKNNPDSDDVKLLNSDVLPIITKLNTEVACEATLNLLIKLGIISVD